MANPPVKKVYNKRVGPETWDERQERLSKGTNRLQLDWKSVPTHLWCLKTHLARWCGIYGEYSKHSGPIVLKDGRLVQASRDFGIYKDPCGITLLWFPRGDSAIAQLRPYRYRSGFGTGSYTSVLLPTDHIISLP